MKGFTGNAPLVLMFSWDDFHTLRDILETPPGQSLAMSRLLLRYSQKKIEWDIVLVDKAPRSSVQGIILTRARLTPT
jgi:hypothetical protein